MKQKLLSDLNVRVLGRETAQHIKGGNQICCIGSNCIDCGPGGSCNFSNGSYPRCGRVARDRNNAAS